MPPILPDLRRLEGYYLTPLPAGTKRPVLDGWPALRLTVDDLQIRSHSGNVGLLTGPLYSTPAGMAGVLDVDADALIDGRPLIDSPDSIVQPLLDELAELRIPILGALRTGGEHRGFRVLLWLDADAWLWRWPGRGELAGFGIELHGAGRQCLVPPSAVEVPYRWLHELAPRSTAEALAVPPEAARALFDLFVEGADPDAAATPSDGCNGPLPATMPPRTAALLDELAAAGVRFGTRGRKGEGGGSSDWRDGVKCDRGGGILGVVLWCCPACGGKGNHGQGRFTPGRGFVTFAGRLTCKGGTCEAHEESGGLPLSDWLPRFFPDLAAGFPWQDWTEGGRRIAGPDLPEHFTLDEVRDETRGMLADLLCGHGLSEGDVVLLDVPTGAGKSTLNLDDAMYEANAGRARPVFYLSHREIDEKAKAAEALAAALPHRSLHFRLVHLTGMEKGCKQWGRLLRAARGYSARPLWEMCKSCPQARTCEYKANMRLVGNRHALVFAPYQLAGFVLGKYPRGTPCVVDEQPAAYEVVRISGADVDAIARGEYRPPLAPEWTVEEMERWYAERVRAARAKLAVLDAAERAGAVPDAPYFQELHGEALRRLLPDDLAAALDFDPDAGLHPSPPLAALVNLPEGETLPEGKYAHRRFDELAAAVRAWLAGTGNLALGVPAVYRGPMGWGWCWLRRLALPVVTRKGQAPEKPPVLILAAGSGLDLETLRMLWPDRNVRVEGCTLQEPRAVRRVHVNGDPFTTKRLTVEGRGAALDSTVRRVLPDLLCNWPLLPGRERLRLGVLCPRALCRDLTGKTDNVCGALRLLDAAGIDLIEVGYWGGDSVGTNRFQSVDVLLELGTQRPNLGEMALLAYALQVDAETRGEAPSTATGGELAERTAQRLRMQADGRARGNLRNDGNPVAIIRVGTRMEGAVARTIAIPKGSRAPSVETIIAELLARTLARELGCCGAGLMRVVLDTAEGDETPETCVATEFGVSWGYALTAVRCLSLCRKKRRTLEPCGFERAMRQISQVVKAETKGIEVRTANPGGTGVWVGWDVPGHAGAFEALAERLRQARTRTTAPAPAPTLVAPVDAGAPVPSRRRYVKPALSPVPEAARTVFDARLAGKVRDGRVSLADRAGALCVL